jgi:6-phosphogluconolactonase
MIFVFVVLFSNSQEESTLKLYVGTFTSEGAEGIYLCNFNVVTGKIALNKTFKGVDNPSFLKISSDKKYLYSVSDVPVKVEKSGGFVVAYKIEKNGNLHFINKQISNGAGPCHIDVSGDGKYVAIATYAGGTTSLYTVNADGSLNAAGSVIKNNELEPHPNKTQSHAHSIKFSSFGNTVFSADLGTDQLNIYHLEERELKSYGQKNIKLKSGAGPRHFEFHPNGNTIYVINELNSTIAVVKKRENNWEVAQNISTLPANFSGESYCADIHLSNDRKYLYGSNRGDNSIAVFDVDTESDELMFRGIVPVKGDWPRNFTLSPDGKFLLVANQRSGNITVFKINTETGMPEFTGNEIKLPAPVCLEFL